LQPPLTLPWQRSRTGRSGRVNYAIVPPQP